MESIENRFNRWFVIPLQQLESIPNGDGGFIALAVACFLYERYAKATLSKSNNRINDQIFVDKLARDFNTDVETANTFWCVIRDGILHQGLPKQIDRGQQKLPGYILHHSFTKPFQLKNWGQETVLAIQPWLFVWQVIEYCEDNIGLIEINEKFPFPKIL